MKIATLPTDTSNKFSRELWGKTLSPIFSLWKGLQQQLKDDKLSKIPEKQLKSVDPIESFVYSEYNEATINFAHIKTAFQRLEGILFGNDILVTELEELGILLLKGEPSPK